MKHLKPVVILIIALMSSTTMGAQSFAEKLKDAEKVKSQYGETDDRYLDALSSAIQAAFAEEKDEEANKYRLVHADIVKSKYGENSLEYAEDMWRLGNVSDFKGDDYVYDCYKKAERVYDQLNAQDEFPYCNIMWRLYLYNYDTQKWYTALNYLKKHISLINQWIDKEWKGNAYTYLDLAHGYLHLGRIYLFQLEDYPSAIDAYEKCVSTLEDYKLLKDYEFASMPYQALSILYSETEEPVKAAQWQRRYVNILGQLEGVESDDYLNELSNLRYNFSILDNLDSIKAISHELLSIIETKDHKNGVLAYRDSLYVKIQKDLVSVCSEYQDYPGVIEYSTLFLCTLEDAGQEVSTDYLNCLGNLIHVYHDTNNYLEAYSLFDQYEKVASDLNIKESEQYWFYLSVKSTILTFLHKTRENEETIQEWEKLTTRLYGESSRQALILTFQIANQQENVDQHFEAKESLDKCYEILKVGKSLFNDESDSLLFWAELHNLEGLVYLNQDPLKAEQALLGSIENNKLIGRPYYTPLINLGLLYYQRVRDINKAVKCFEECKELLENIGDTYSITYISVLNNIGICYQELGLNSQAISIFDLSEQTILKDYGKKHPLYGTTEQNKSLFYASISNFPEAIKYGLEANLCYKSFYGENSEKYAVGLQNIGVLYQQVSDFSKSKEALIEAIPILERNNNPFCVSAYIYLLTIYSHDHDYEKLKEIAQKTEDKLIEYNLEETDYTASFYGIMGYIYLTDDNYALDHYRSKGRELLGYALNILKKTGHENTLQYFNCLVLYSLSNFINNTTTEEVIPKLTESYKALYIDNAAFFNSNEREILITGSRFSQVKDIIFTSRDEGKYDTDLYNFMLFNKGLLLGTSIGFAKAVYDSRNEEIISKYERLLSLNRYLNGETNKIDNDISLDEAQVQSSILEREITSFLRQNGGFTDELSYTYSDVKAALNNRALAIEFVNYLDCHDGLYHYAALLVRTDWPEPKFIKLCKTEQLEKLASLSPDKLYGETTVSGEVYNLIWEPLAPYLANIKTVYFSPAGYLNKMAIEHLFNGSKHFDDMYNVIRLTSTRQLCSNSPQYNYSKSVLYGGLRYDEDDATMIAESRNIRGDQPAQPNMFRGYDNSLTRKGWEYLPGTLDEVNQISSIISKSKIKCELYTSVKGNEESFKALSGNNFGILHIATHGFYMTESQAERNDFFASNPFLTQGVTNEVSPLQRSGLLLAGANKAWKGENIPEGVEDGILTAAEIASLDLNSCDIVVLSACETGLGEITDEGVLGLQRAFKNAGVNTIIMSLWEVDDRATTLMMESFYKNLMKGKSKRESFTEAQNEVKKKYADPRYWAAFIMLD